LVLVRNALEFKEDLKISVVLEVYVVKVWFLRIVLKGNLKYLFIILKLKT
jgi:hypothetical protein